MQKTIATCVLVVAIAYSSLVPARSQGVTLDRATSADAADVMTDARIGAVKAVLKLTPAQEALWPSVESALWDLLRMRAERRRVMHEDSSLGDPIQRFRQRAETIMAIGNGLKKLADSAESLFRSLDEAQKQRVRLLLLTVGSRHADRLQPINETSFGSKRDRLR